MKSNSFFHVLICDECGATSVSSKSVMKNNLCIFHSRKWEMRQTENEKKLYFYQIRKYETTYVDISAHQAEMGVQNCSSLSVRRFCHSHNLSRRGVVSDTHLELAVAQSINQATPILYRLIIVRM